MKKRLIDFEQTIKIFFNLNNPVAGGSPESEIADRSKFEEQLNLQRIELRTVLDELLFSTKPEHFIGRVLQIFHTRLALLSDLLYTRLKGLDNFELRELHTRCVVYIDDLLQYAMSAYPQYFNAFLTMTAYETDTKGTTLQIRYAAIESKLVKKRVNTVFLKIFEDYFKFHSSDSNERFTYVQYRYAEKLLNGIEEACCQVEVLDWEGILWELVVKINFNADRILQYAKVWIYNNAICDREPAIHHEGLELLLKQVNQMDENQNWCYQSGGISVKAHTENLIKEELLWLEKKQTELYRAVVENNKQFFMLDVTVKQLNLWADINVLLKRIPYHNASQVIRVLTLFIRTVHAGTISYESARKKIGNYDPPTVKGLHEYLSDQLSVLETKYGHMLTVFLIANLY